MNGRAGEVSLKKGQELYDLLLAKPLATVSPGEQVILVPDGILGALPFEALVMAAGLDAETSIFVGDQRVLRYSPSATVLAQQRGRPEKATTRPLLALGNPLYQREEPPQAEKKKKPEKTETAAMPEQTEAPDRSILATHAAWGATTRGKTGNQGMIFSPLPETEALVQGIAQVFLVEPIPPDILLGRQANETQLRQSPLQDYRYLHFATHADLTDKVQGRLEPFILLGQSGNKTPDDGFLTLSEILDLDLGAQMVVLDHGRAGRGGAMEGEGVISLARAFQYAGARSVLVSLWEAKPEVAQEFLIKFYGHLKAGKSSSEALRLARFDIRMQYPDPVFWAGFVLYGEG
jgi:CHAT domain-containing protein